LVSIKNNSRGFTLTELNITLIVGAIVLLTISAIFTNYFTLITRNNLYVEMTADSQNLLRSMVEELRYGAGVRQINTLTDTHMPPDGWNTNNEDFVIIIAVPVKDSDGNYVIDTETGSAYKNEYVYFKEGINLYKRVLANPNASGNTAITTCPANLASPSCPADVKLVEGIDTVVFQLYDQDDASTTDPLLARSVNIFVSLERDTFGEPIRVDNNMRITLRNTI
jgi:prepilin-type N-terminal cleavage/methylation domain-containing protein